MMILAVFRSRSNSIAYAEQLISYGVQASTVSVPKEAKIGCGLCVRFDARYFIRARAVLKAGRYSSFASSRNFVYRPVQPTFTVSVEP